MKFHITKHSFLGTYNLRKLMILALAFSLFTTIPFYLLRYALSPLRSLRISLNSLESTGLILKECDIFVGNWVHHLKGPYYTNDTCPLIIPQQNCMKSGRPDKEYLQWRWRPDQCELPLFNPALFLELVRGKSVAFVGDSVARNQMQSLSCLLASVGYPVDVSRTDSSDSYFADWKHTVHWKYSGYNFTLSAFWSPFLVKAVDADPERHSFDSKMSLHLDQADEKWTSQIEGFDYVIISAGQWFFRPLNHYKDGKFVACHKCRHQKKNVRVVDEFYGYRMAFRTALEALHKLKRFKGVTFLRTYSPQHFDNGPWNRGGSCARTRPFTPNEVTLDGSQLQFYLTQVEELRKAEEQGKEKGLKFLLLATTELMLLRPDGHPNRYGHSPEANVTAADCVHWCLPGPIDTWNELLLYMMVKEKVMSKAS